MDHRQLRSFNAIARLGSIRRAAESLHISQPALSRQIHLLEDQLGVPLFTRKSRGVELTSAGQLLLVHSEIIMSQIASAEADIAAGSSNAIGNVAVGVAPALSLILYGPLAELVARQHPGIRLTLFEGVTYQLADWLESGRIDLAILSDTKGADFLMEHLVDEEVYLVAGGGLKLPPVIDDFRQLRDYPLILPGQGVLKTTWVEELMLAHKIKLDVVYRVESLTLAKHLIQRGLAFGILGRAAIEEETRKGLVSAICLPGLRIPRYLARFRDRASTNAMGIIAQLLREEMGAADQKGLFRQLERTVNEKKRGTG